MSNKISFLEKDITIQNINDLYSNQKDFEILLRNLETKKASSIYIINSIKLLLERYPFNEQDEPKKKMDFLLKSLFLSLDDKKFSSIFLILLLEIDDVDFAREQFVIKRGIISDTLKKYKLYGESAYTPKTLEKVTDIDYHNSLDKGMIIIKNENKVINELVKHFFLELNSDNFDSSSFSYLFYTKKEKSFVYTSLENPYYREITPFFLQILHDYQIISPFLLNTIIDATNLEPILKNIKIVGDLDILFYQALKNNKEVNFLRKKLENITPTEEEKNQKVPTSFFYQLKKLKEQYQKVNNYSLLVDSLEYTTCRKVFFYKMKQKYRIQNDGEDRLLHQLFIKLIKGERLFTLINFNDLKSLRHYNRTKNSVINTSLFTKNDLESYSYKEFKILLKIANNKDFSKRENSTELQPLQRENDVLKLLLVFGFQLANKLLSIYDIAELKDFISAIDTSQEHYKQQDEYLTYVLKENAIFKLKNKFLLSSRQEYFIVKLILHDVPTLKQLKSFKETNEIGLTPNIRLIEPYFKFNHSKTPGEFLERAIDIYCQYRDRYTSYIPDLIGRKDEFDYRTIDFQDPRAVFLGDEINCCLSPLEKAESALLHSLLDNNGRLFGIFLENKLISLSWIWRNNGLLCFDNIETDRKELKNAELGNKLFHIYVEAAKKFYDISRTTEPPREAITTVTLGRNKIDICMPDLIQNCKEVAPKSLKWYTPKENKDLYIKDSQQQQFILYTDNTSFLQQENSSTIYRRTRNKPINFEDMNAYDLKSRIDYCRERAHLPITDRGYIYGIISDDYYLGINDKFELESVYFGNDIRGKKEMNSYLLELKKKLLFYQQKEKNFQEIKENLLKHQWKTNFNEFICEMEKQPSIDFNKDNYYHGTSLKMAISILEQKRITCKFRCLNRVPASLNSGSNAGFHICVTKNLDGNRLFESYVKNKISFVLNKDLPIALQTKNNYSTNDIRCIPYSDEFQVSDTIPLACMEAISIPIKGKEDLINAKIIRETLETFDVDLPIVNITHKKILSKSFIDKYVTPKKRSS